MLSKHETKENLRFIAAMRISCIKIYEIVSNIHHN